MQRAACVGRLSSASQNVYLELPPVNPYSTLPYPVLSYPTQQQQFHGVFGEEAI